MFPATLIADLAGQAGLVLRNVRLNEELKVTVRRAEGAQKRLVSAQDEGRRRFERNIHDGAQQQLVALAVKLKLADNLIERDTTKAHDLLEQTPAGDARGAPGSARPGPRHLPPLLADKGLPAALEAQGRKSGLPADAPGDGVGRYPQAVEAAVYFSCLEALQNVAKYAQASNDRHRRWPNATSASVHGASTTVAVRSGGASYGTGLQGIADRLGALEGGSRDVVTRPWNDARGIAPRGRARDGVRVSGPRRSDPRRSRKGSVGSSDGWSGWRWA